MADNGPPTKKMTEAERKRLARDMAALARNAKRIEHKKR